MIVNAIFFILKLIISIKVWSNGFGTQVCESSAISFLSQIFCCQITIIYEPNEKVSTFSSIVINYYRIFVGYFYFDSRNSSTDKQLNYRSIKSYGLIQVLVLGLIVALHICLCWLHSWLDIKRIQEYVSLLDNFKLISSVGKMRQW